MELDSDVAIPSFFEQLVENAQDAVLFLDRDGVVRYWNESAERIFGYSAEEMVGESIERVVPERYREAHRRGYARAMEAGESPYDPGEVLSVPARDAEAERVSVELTMMEVRDESGALAGLGAIARDVTERFEREKARKERIEELEARVEELSE